MKKIIGFAAAMVFAASAIAETTVGLILVGPKTDGGWSMRHFQGMEESGYKFDVVEMVPEAEAEKTINRLARKHKVVIATSFGYMDPMLKAAKKNKNTYFLHATGFKDLPNMDNYNCRNYQSRYLTGVALGMLTKTNKIGVVGSHPIPEIITNINALTLGARSVNPDVVVEIVWINSWFDPPKDLEAAKALIDNGNDALVTTTDSPSVVTLAEKRSTSEKPIWSTGNDADMSSYGPNQYVTGPMFNWHKYYKYKLDQIDSGNFKVEKAFWGLDTECASLSQWGKNVPDDVVSSVEGLRKQWVAGKKDEWFPFSEGFTKQDGSVVSPNTFKRHEIETAQFFVEGVISKFPQASE